MRNAVCILANNMEYFSLFVQNYPEELRSDDYRLIVANEIRIGDKTKEIKRILKKENIKNYRLITSDEVNKKLKKEVIDNGFVNDYTMSMNILSLWYIKKYMKDIQKVLLLDDDVILRKGISDLFISDIHLFKSNRLSAGLADFEKQSKNAKNIYNEWFRIFNIDFSEDWWKNKYLKKYANSGQRLIILDKLDLNRYEDKLRDFFSSDIFYEAWQLRRSHISWYFDERFETFYFFNELNDELRKTTFLIVSKTEKLTDSSVRKMLRSYIIHNATNSWKKKTYNFMIENGVIRGEKLDD